MCATIHKTKVIDMAFKLKTMILHASSNDNRDKGNKAQDKQHNEAGHFDESIDSTKYELSRRGNKF